MHTMRVVPSLMLILALSAAAGAQTTGPDRPAPQAQPPPAPVLQPVTPAPVAPAGEPPTGPDRPAPQVAPSPPAPVGAGGAQMAMIDNGGSLTSPAFRITVFQDGRVDYVQLPGPWQTVPPPTRTRRISSDVTHRFFVDLQQAMPLTQYSVPVEPKTLDFAVSEVVWYQGQRSPDLGSWPNADRLNPVSEDVRTIEQSMHIAYP